jgi:hypothetical protein
MDDIEPTQPSDLRILAVLWQGLQPTDVPRCATSRLTSNPNPLLCPRSSASAYRVPAAPPRRYVPRIPPQLRRTHTMHHVGLDTPSRTPPRLRQGVEAARASLDTRAPISYRHDPELIYSLAAGRPIATSLRPSPLPSHASSQRRPCTPAPRQDLPASLVDHPRRTSSQILIGFRWSPWEPSVA